MPEGSCSAVYKVLGAEKQKWLCNVKAAVEGQSHDFMKHICFIDTKKFEIRMGK